jgi:hypothetical protein
MLMRAGEANSKIVAEVVASWIVPERTTPEAGVGEEGIGSRAVPM